MMDYETANYWARSICAVVGIVMLGLASHLLVLTVMAHNVAWSILTAVIVWFWVGWLHVGVRDERGEL